MVQVKRMFLVANVSGATVLENYAKYMKQITGTEKKSGFKTHLKPPITSKLK